VTGLAVGWVVVALAAYRLARIVAEDAISDVFREHVYEWAWDEQVDVVMGQEVATPVARAAWRTYVYALVSCPLCLGVWFAAGLYVVWRWWTWMPAQAFVIVLAIAGLQCFLATREGA
jgi:hypothetical protein